MRQAWPLFDRPGGTAIVQDKAPRINLEINSPEIRLVGEEGEQLGIVPLAEAMAKAEAAELDLVEIAPTAKPPVCRIMSRPNTIFLLLLFFMRTTLAGGLLDVLRTNLSRQHDRVRVFELGRCFLRDGNGDEQPLRVGGVAYGPALHENRYRTQGHRR